MLNQKNSTVSNGYLTYMVNYHKELPAFSRRPLTTFLIETTSQVSGLTIGHSFILVNYVLFFLSGLLLFSLSMHLTGHYWHSLLNIVVYFLGFSVLFAFFSPIYTYDEPMQYSLIFLGMWAFFKERWVLFVLSFTLAAIARETSLLLIPALAFFFMDIRSLKSRISMLKHGKKFVFILLPIVLYAIYLVLFLRGKTIVALGETELANRFSCFVENFQTPKNAMESLASLVLALGAPLYLLWSCVKHNPLSLQQRKFADAFLFLAVVNSMVVLVLTFARETRLFALPLFFLWPLAGQLFTKEFSILLSYKLYYPCFRKWHHLFLFLLFNFLNYILSFRIYESSYDPIGESHLFNEYLFVMLLVISTHFLLRHFLDKNPSYEPFVIQLKFRECNSSTTHR